MQADFETPYLLIKPGIPEEELYALGEDSDWELLDGRLVMPSASNRHEDLFRFLLTLLSLFLDTRGGGVVRGFRYPMRLDERWSPSPISSWSVRNGGICYSRSGSKAPRIW